MTASTPELPAPDLPSLEPLGIEGAWVFTPRVLGDSRGAFAEWLRGAQFTEAVGHPVRVAQANLSVSQAGVVRGIHLAALPPGQAKYVTCVSGSLLDLIVDVRLGSPTFGRYEFVRLDDADRRAVYLSEGLGHGFVAETDDTTIAYLVSEPYDPVGEFGIHPYDPELGIDWPSAHPPVLSDRDAAAPTLAQVRKQSRLPSYDACVEFRRNLAD